jgi:hypothetical protein
MTRANADTAKADLGWGPYPRLEPLKPLQHPSAFAGTREREIAHAPRRRGADRWRGFGQGVPRPAIGYGVSAQRGIAALRETSKSARGGGEPAC